METLKESMDTCDMIRCCVCSLFYEPHMVFPVTGVMLEKFNIQETKSTVYICLDCSKTPLISSVKESEGTETGNDPGNEQKENQDCVTETSDTPKSTSRKEHSRSKATTQSAICMIPGCKNPQTSRCKGLPAIFYRCSEALQQKAMSFFKIPVSDSRTCYPCRIRITNYLCWRNGEMKKSRVHQNKLKKPTKTKKRDVVDCVQCGQVYARWKMTLVEGDMAVKYNIPDNKTEAGRRAYVCVRCTYTPNTSSCSEANTSWGSTELSDLNKHGQNQYATCMNKKCLEKSSLRNLPGRFHRVSKHVQDKVLKAYGLEDGKATVCKNCWFRVYSLIKYHESRAKNQASDRSKSSTPAGVPPSKCMDQFGCGWCKFTGATFGVIAKHHYKTHRGAEFNAISLTDKKDQMPYNCNCCMFSCRFRIEMNLHIEKMHGKKSGETSANYHSDVDMFEDTSDKTPGVLPTKTRQNKVLFPEIPNTPCLPTNFSDSFYSKGKKGKSLKQKSLSIKTHRKQFRLKSLQVNCVDFLHMSMENLFTSIHEHGVRKLNVDALMAEDIVQFAAKNRGTVKYKNSNVKDYRTHHLREFSTKEIRRLFTR